MKYIRVLLIIININEVLFSQNLVDNYSFEDTIKCPDLPSQISYASSWFQPNQAGSSSDYYNKCSFSFFTSIPSSGAGFQNPKTGDAYAGIFLYNHPSDGREYIEIQLNQSLTGGKNYCVEFYVSLAEVSNYAVDAIGAYFSVDSLVYNDPSYSNLNVEPQIKNPIHNIITDKINWIKVSGQFIANGGEKFITIGNFVSTSNTDTLKIPGAFGSYYFIDDISVEESTSANAGRDTTICEGDTIMLGTAADTSISYSWLPNNSLSNLTIAQPVATPTITTTYYLTINTNNINCKILNDSVTITVINCDTIQNIIYIPNVFSPNVDGVNDEFNIHGSNIKTVNCKIYNRWGQEIIKVERSPLNHSEVTLWDGRTLSGVECPTGVYVYYLNGTYTDGEPIEKWGNVTLIR